MNSDMLHRFLKDSLDIFYTNLFSLSCQATAIITTLYFLKKEPKAVYFFIYSCSALCLFLTSEFFLVPTGAQHYTFLTEGANMIFALIEYIVFYNFFQTVLATSGIKKFMRFFYTFLMVSILLILLSRLINPLSCIPIRKLSDFIISSELLALTSLCLVYYFESFYKKTTSDLKSSPSFWIVTGLFFYSIIIAPFFMITDEIIESNKKFYFIAYSVHYTSFGVLFLAITKAFFMRKPVTT